MGQFSKNNALVAVAILVVVGLVIALWWPEGRSPQVAGDTEAEVGQDEADDTSSDEEEGEDAPEDDEVVEGEAGYKPELSQERWDVVETMGEEGALVETVYDAEEGWSIEGWRVKGVSLYGAPPFWVPARKVDDVPLFPCSDCHETKQPYDPKPRRLTEEHDDLIVNHANDRLWCTDCHGGKGMDFVISRRGKPIDIDQSHVQCGECHFHQLKDWEFGVHGRRIGLFAGERVLRTCTECHNAHRPQILPDKPSPPPRFRANLSGFAPKPKSHPPVWERFGKGYTP